MGGNEVITNIGAGAVDLGLLFIEAIRNIGLSREADD